MVNTLVSIPGYRISEKLYNGSRTLVYRGYRETDSLPVVIKLLKNPYPSFSELLLFRNQYTIAKNFNSPLIIQSYSLEPYQNGYALVIEDFGGISLKDYFTFDQTRYITSLEEFLEIAITLCNTLDILYRNRIIHKDIKPANILINPETKQVKLIDFSIASLLPRETQTLINPNILEGTLAYISPEQTGRMNRGIDYRTDFYSLGVTFYELLTGELPFQSNEPMELVHCHIAKLPPLVHKINPQIPSVLSEIVSKLMAKNAEDRYQSALGLKFDLENCLHQLQVCGNINSFEIARRDLCDRFIIPDKLYGRETEVENLLQAFERVSLGATEIMLVAGFSGIGKTAVVNEVHKPIVRQRGYFIKGKYDQFQRNIPLSAFVQAFRDLIAQLLTESDAQIQQWKNKILAAVGDNGQVVIEVIPELSRIIGQQPPAIELSGTAAQNRFNLIFQKFTQVFTSTEHPLVMFLDDLQWADSASLMLIQLLMTDTKHLLLIGAYRDNEVNLAHPLILTLNNIQKIAATINTITLAPLSQGQVNQLVADTLKSTEDLVLPLSLLVFRKTQGNPFFAIQFLKALHQDGLIEFNLESGNWQCDITEIDQQAVTDDVVNFMAFQLQKLPQSTQYALQLAACIGNQFDLPTLAIVSEKLEIETAASLWKALQEGLILPINDVYKFYQDSSLVSQQDIGSFPHERLALATKEGISHTLQEGVRVASPRVAPMSLEKSEEKTVCYKFLHDRVQQAAYSLIPDNQKQATHLKIGQLLLQNSSQIQQEEKLFDIVGHLNRGIELITQSSDREALAKMNLKAGVKARNSTAYTAAKLYMQAGIDLLASDRWQCQYDLTLALYEGAANSAYLNTDFEQIEQFAEIVLNHAHSWVDRINIYETKILACMAQNQQLEALRLAREVLAALGVPLPEQPTETDIGQAIQHTQTLRGGRTIESLLELPQMTAANPKAAMVILSQIISAAYQVAPNLLLLIILAHIDLSVQYGNAPESANGYVIYGLIQIAVLGDIDAGGRFGQLGMNLSGRIHAPKLTAKIIFGCNCLLRHWQEPVKNTLLGYLQAYTSGLEVGDIEYSAMSLTYYDLTAYYSGQELSSLKREIEIHCEIVQQLRQDTYLYTQRIYCQAIANLLETRAEPDQLYGEYCHEAETISLLVKTNDMTALYCIYFNKLLLCYLFQRYEQALENLSLAEQYLGATAGLIYVPLFSFYDALVQLAIYPTANETEQTTILNRVAAHQEKLKKWATHAPSNQAHRCALIAAERCRVLAARAEALEHYDRAITLAKANGYIQEEALSNELTAKFYLDWGKEKVAQVYMQEAYYCYARWGAKAKIEDLEKRYPQLLQSILQQQRINLKHDESISFRATSSSTRMNTTGSTSISDALDFTSVLKAAIAISSSLELDTLITSLTRIILENSGAKKAVLILPQDQDTAVRGFPRQRVAGVPPVVATAAPFREVSGNTWQVRATTFINHEKIETILSRQSISNCQDIPVQVINYVKNTQQTVVIDNCQTDIIGLIGEYMHSSQPRSVLCTPIINQGRLVGILYLENQLTQGVFTSDRLSVINFFCTQAAISLENAQLYNHLQEREKFLSSIYEGVGCLIFVTDIRDNGRYEYTGWSKSCEVVIGIPASEVLGKSPQELMAADEVGAIEQKYLHCFQTGIPITYEECLTFNHQKIWLLTTLTPLKDETGKVYRVVGTTINISDVYDELRLRKQAEEAVTEKSQALGTALEDLQQAQLQIIQSEKMSALGNLVAGVAHEMNNPLGFIAASLKQAKPTIADVVEHLKLYQATLPNANDEIKEHAEEIDLDYTLVDLPKVIDSMVMACDRLKNISTSLRTFSRADKDYKVPFNIHEGIDSTILILKHRLKANEQRPAVKVNTEYSNLPQVECFPGQLNQVFMNILANAIDALDESNTGRDFREIQENPNKITIQTSLKGNQVQITIADNANGMNEEVKQKIFDHLFTTKAVGKGTGLGLAIAKSIVAEKHSGSIKVNSIPGKGTEFVILLPIKAD